MERLRREFLFGLVWRSHISTLVVKE